MSPSRPLGDGWVEARYWKARAGELEKRLDDARARLVALTDALPPELVDLLQVDVSCIETSEWAESAVVGIGDSHTFTPGDVAEELEQVWQRVRRRRNGDG